MTKNGSLFYYKAKRLRNSGAATRLGIYRQTQQGGTHSKL